MWILESPQCFFSPHTLIIDRPFFSQFQAASLDSHWFHVFTRNVIMINLCCISFLSGGKQQQSAICGWIMICISWWTGLSTTITATPAAALNAYRIPRLQISNVIKNWSELSLNRSLSCPLTHAPTMCTPLALNSALNWKQYWAPGLQNEFVYDYSCPGALQALGNVCFIELGCILFSFPLPFMSVLAGGGYWLRWSGFHIRLALPIDPDSHFLVGKCSWRGNVNWLVSA